MADSRRGAGFALLLLVVALATLLAPTVRNVAVSTTSYDWRASPRFDGTAYLVSPADSVEAERDATGVAAVIATFDRWRGGDATEASVVQEIEDSDLGYRLSDVEELAASYGFEGRWVEAEIATLPRLKVPVVAHLSDGGGRVVIVRNVAIGHVYVTDPARGNVLYPLERFAEVWTGRAFAFPEPPAAPEAWR